jgi:hypothetical protein
VKKLYFALLSHHRSLIKNPSGYLSDGFRRGLLGNYGIKEGRSYYAPALGCFIE